LRSVGYRALSCLFLLDRLKTPKRAVFAGSMQLLAGIKLCTGRILTNHPHYEDQVLRERTRQASHCFHSFHNSIQALQCPGPQGHVFAYLVSMLKFCKTKYWFVIAQQSQNIHLFCLIYIVYITYTVHHNGSELKIWSSFQGLCIKKCTTSPNHMSKESDLLFCIQASLLK